MNRDLWRPGAADEDYRLWLLGLGRVEKAATVDNLDVYSVSIATGKTPPEINPE